MRLACYSDTGADPRAGVVAGDVVVDVAELLEHPGPLRDVRALLQVPDVLDRLRERLDDRNPRAGVPLADVRLLPPVLQPPNIRDHIAFEEHATRQFTRPVADVWRRRPIHYYSNTSRLTGHDAPVTQPASERLDFELEVAVVVNTECSDVAPDDALDVILGFTIMNDWSARDLQADEMAYGLGPAKGKDFATSLGPWVVTTDELLPRLGGGTLDAECVVRVNGAVWAEGNSVHQFHSWGAMLAHASQDSRLVPGDVIASGTVGGCSIGEAIRKGYDARYLVPGDRVELQVAGIGILANDIVANPRAGEARYRAHELPPMPKPLPGSVALP